MIQKERERGERKRGGREREREHRGHRNSAIGTCRALANNITRPSFLSGGNGIKKQKGQDNR